MLSRDALPLPGEYSARHSTQGLLMASIASFSKVAGQQVAKVFCTAVGVEASKLTAWLCLLKVMENG